LEEAEKASHLVKRRLVVATTGPAAAMSFIQGRMARLQLLPRVVVTVGRDDEFRTMVPFLLGMEGGRKSEGMPLDVFRVMLSMLRKPRVAG
jgi:hypothetical protein